MNGKLQFAAAIAPLALTECQDSGISNRLNLREFKGGLKVSSRVQLIHSTHFYV